MYDEEEIQIVGIVPDRELRGDVTNENELKKIIYDALSIGPMYEPLIKDLKSKGHICEKTSDIK
jgi:hypothetical protein